MMVGQVPVLEEIFGGKLGWWRRTALILFPGYLLLVALTIGLRAEHLVATGLILTLAVIGSGYGRFALVFLPIWVTGAVYDFSRLIEGARGRVHVADLHRAELLLFGINTEAGRQTLSEFLQSHTTAILDVVCGAAYILYLLIPLAVIAAFFFLDVRRAVHLSLVFLLMNLMGIAIYNLYPAAPPWYVAHYGLGPAILDVPASPAGTLRFDEALGIPFFQNWYARSANVFGAMPSLHVAYPTAAFLVCIGRRWIPTTSLGLFALLVAFSAVYLNHHYVLDVIAGVIVAVVADTVVRLIMHRATRWAEARGRARAVGVAAEGRS